MRQLLLALLMVTVSTVVARDEGNQELEQQIAELKGVSKAA